MITGSVRNQVDAIWDAFWSGGISNPLEVIEQITYLLFIKMADERQIRNAQGMRLADSTRLHRYRAERPLL